MTDERPPYRVPSMAEIKATPPNGYRMVSTFSGCGGSCLGFRMAGFDVAWASEFIESARDTYHANYPDTFIDPRDIREVTPQDILDHLSIKKGDLDLFEGSPPCASFSLAGKRDKHWGKVKKYSDGSQRTDDLFFEYARLVEGLQPKVFVAENVTGMVLGSAKGYYKQIHKALSDCGYKVEARILDASWLGVPQARRRLIFIGVRDGLLGKDGEQLMPVFPTPLPYRYAIRDALPHLCYVTGRVGNAYKRRPLPVEEPINAILASGAEQTRYEVTDDPKVRVVSTPGYIAGEREFSLDEPFPTVLAQDDRLRVEGDGPALGKSAVGREWDKLKAGEKSDRYFNLIKPDPNQPLPTVTAVGGASAGVASVTHPTERRKFTIAELRRLCAFPDDFLLEGKYSQQWERLGRAVPPIMARAIAEAIRDGILAKQAK